MRYQCERKCDQKEEYPLFHLPTFMQDFMQVTERRGCDWSNRIVAVMRMCRIMYMT